MEYIFSRLMHGVGHINTTQWALVLMAVVVVGTLCLRGHSSHSNY